jgi:hypothetical protein
MNAPQHVVAISSELTVAVLHLVLKETRPGLAGGSFGAFLPPVTTPLPLSSLALCLLTPSSELNPRLKPKLMTVPAPACAGVAALISSPLLRELVLSGSFLIPRLSERNEPGGPLTVPSRRSSAASSSPTCRDGPVLWCPSASFLILLKCSSLASIRGTCR